MKRRRTHIEVFGTSFLDIICCALGAVLLHLLHSMASSHADATEYRELLGAFAKREDSLISDIEGTKASLAALESRANRERAALEASLKEAELALGEFEEAHNKQIAILESKEKDLKQALSAKQAVGDEKKRLEAELDAVLKEMRLAENAFGDRQSELESEIDQQKKKRAEFQAGAGIEKSRLSTRISDLEKVLEQYERGFTDKISALQRDMKQEGLAHLGKVKEMEKELARVKGQLAAADKDHRGRMQQAEAEIARLNGDLNDQDQKHKGQLSSLQKEMSRSKGDLIGERNELAGKLEEYKAGLEEAQDEIALFRRKVDELEKEGGRFKNLTGGVVGLRGAMKKVVFLFDTSDSMRERERDAIGRTATRFTEYTEILKAWIPGIKMEEFAVVEFDSDIRHSFEGKFRKWNTASVVEAIKWIDTFAPDGSTYTERAFAEVFRTYPDVDTIIFFTDGQPMSETTGEGWQKQEMKPFLRRLKSEHPAVVINTVAMANYLLDDEGIAPYAWFLQQMAHDHGGTFIGR